MNRLHRSAGRTAIAVLAWGLLAGLVAALVGSSAGAGADATDARTRRAAVRVQQAQVASQVDALEGDQASVLAALSALDENVRGQQAALTEAQRQADASRAAADRAEAEAASTTRELERLRIRVAKYAISAYQSPPDEELFRGFEASTAKQDADRQAFLELRSSSDVDAIDQLRQAKRRLEEELDRARRARSDADARVAEVSAALGSLTAAQRQQQVFAEKVRERLDERLSDAMYFAGLDSSLSAQISAEEKALSGAVSNVPPPPVDGGGSGGSGASGGGTTTTTTPVVVPPTPGLVTVGGITVAASIGELLRQLLAAARADGINLSGYGYRDINRQIQLRRQNCGTSSYAIYQMAAGSCSPPTARPGYSMHEQGLAIDFQSNGAFINTHSNPGFVWLAANAARFGFHNLPSEPWHWSVSGY